MALGTGIADARLHAAKHQEHNVYTKENHTSLPFGNKPPSHRREPRRAPRPVRKRRDTNTDTAAPHLDTGLWNESDDSYLTPAARTHSQGLSTSTAYAKDTDAMVGLLLPTSNLIPRKHQNQI